MFRVVLAGALVASTYAAGAGTWNYDNADTANGPAKWEALCADDKVGQQQSPVHLCGATLWGEGAPQLSFGGYDSTVEWTLKNPDTRLGGVQIVPPAGVTLKADGLPAAIGRDVEGSAINGYKLAQMHFHWCSEHHIEGRQPPLEAHFVHMSDEYETLGDALASGKRDALLVVGQFYEVFSSESPALKTIADGLVEMKNTPKKLLKASQLIDATGGYYSYPGSLTTPTCNPVVTWVVLANVMPITQASLDKFLAVQGETGVETAKHGNARPLLPLNGRTVYATSNVKSMPCPTEENLCTYAGPKRGMGPTGSEDAELVGGILGAISGVLLLALIYMCSKKNENRNEVIVSSKPEYLPTPGLVTGFTMGVPSMPVVQSVQSANGVPMKSVHMGV